MDEDFSLLDRWSSGETAAGNQLFKRHFETLYRFFELKVHSDIDDLVQETFLACMRSRERFRRQSAFRTFLLAIARNTLFNHWRKHAPERTAIDFDEISIESLSTSAGTRLAKRDERALLLTALRTLPLDHQLLLEMYYWEELDRSQLAEVFDVEVATIGSRLFRARETLREQLRTVSQVPSDPDFDAWATTLRSDEEPS